MPYSILKKAICSPHSTILVSSLGRHPFAVEHYLSPHLVPCVDRRKYTENDRPPDDEDVWFKSVSDGKSVYLWIEPAFGTAIPSGRRNLVLTSHLDLEWDHATTRVAVLRDYIPSLSGFRPDSELFGDARFVPGNRHPHAAFRVREGRDGVNVTLDLRNVGDAHDAYLRVLSFCDVWKGTWNLCMPRKLRKRMTAHARRSHDSVAKHVTFPRDVAESIEILGR